MVTVQEATEIVLKKTFVPKTHSVNLEQANGCILRETIIADRDLPPFDRVTMDGIAINFSEFTKGSRKFPIESTQAAGQSKASLADQSKSIEIMTGAMLPTGCDTVIRYEDLDIKDHVATIKIDDVRKGQNIHYQGQDVRGGETILKSGMILSAAEIALLASVGKTTVDVVRPPLTAVVSSGDELVSIEIKPQPHQIRRSNSYAILAAMDEMKWPGAAFHFADEKKIITDSLSKILDTHDLLILSGGVSKGKFDFIPQALEELGVQKLFHEVSQRPGKPFWFGASERGKIVFALPGNPVSTFMCFHRYIKPWYYQSTGVNIKEKKALLGKDFTFEPKLTYFLQVSTELTDGRLVANPNAGGGSGDFANLKDVDGFIELPLEKSHFKAGEAYRFIPFR